MTSPFSFPDVTPRTTPQRNELDDFAQLLLGVHKMQQDFAVQKEGLDLERRRTEQSEETGAAQRKQINAELDERQADIDARTLATHYLPMVLAPGGATLENLATQRVRLLEEAGKDKKRNLGVRALKAFDEAIADAEKARGQMALRRTSEVAADVAEKTHAAQVEAGNLDPKVKKAQLEEADAGLQLRRIQTKLENLRLAGFDAARINSMYAGMDMGLTIGESARIQGITLPPDIDPNMRKPVPSADGGVHERQMNTYANVLDLANSQLNELGNKGLNAAAYANLATNSITADYLTNVVMSDEQRSLLSAYSLFLQPFNRMMAGGNASDLDLANARRTLVTRASDSEATRIQKQLLRNALPIVLRNTEGMKRSDQLAAILVNAKAQKIDAKLLGPIETLRKKEEAAERALQSRAGSAHTGSDASSTAASVLQRNNIVIGGRRP